MDQPVPTSNVLAFLKVPEIYKFKLCSMYAKYIEDGVTNNDYISTNLQLKSGIYSDNTASVISFQHHLSGDQPQNPVSSIKTLSIEIFI